MRKLRWDMFPTIEYNCTQYNVEAEKRCPLSQIVFGLYDRIPLIGPIKLLLSGEGSLGKTSNMLAMRIDLIKEKKPFYYCNLKNLNSDNLEVIKKLIEELSEEYIVLLDSYDEAPSEYAKKVIAEGINCSHAKLVVVASRYNSFVDDGSTLLFAGFEKLQVLALSDGQVNAVLKSIDFDINSVSSSCLNFLKNTMFLSLFVDINKMKKNRSVSNLENAYNVKVVNEYSLIKEYFKELSYQKNPGVKKQDAWKKMRDAIKNVGEAVYYLWYFDEYYSPSIDNLLNGIFFENWRGIIDSTQIRYLSIALAFYIASEIEKKYTNRVQDCLAFFQHKWILNNKFFTPILHSSSRTALADALSYAGQIIKSLDCGEAIMKSLNTLLEEIDWQRDVFMAHLLLGYNNGVLQDIENTIYLDRFWTGVDGRFLSYSKLIKAEKNSKRRFGMCTDFKLENKVGGFFYSSVLTELYVKNRYYYLFFTGPNLKKIIICKDYIDDIAVGFSWHKYLKEESECNNYHSIYDNIEDFAVKTIEVETGNTRYCYDNGVIIDNKTASIIRADKDIVTCNVPKGIDKIAKEAFEGNKNLKAIDFPEGLSVIDECAFANCESLFDIIFPQSLLGIARGAFSCCIQLYKIVIPPNVWLIGKEAFYGCDKAEGIIVSGTNAIIDSEAFALCINAQNVVINQGIVRIMDRAFAACIKLGKIFIPDSVVEVGSNIFDGCLSLSEISIPKHLKGKITLPKLPSDLFSENYYNELAKKDMPYLHCKILVRD